MTLSYDLELERQGTQGSLAAADHDKTVDDGRTDAVVFRVRHRLAEFFDHDANTRTLLMVAPALDTIFVPIPGHLHITNPNKHTYRQPLCVVY